MVRYILSSTYIEIIINVHKNTLELCSDTAIIHAVLTGFDKCKDKTWWKWWLTRTEKPDLIESNKSVVSNKYLVCQWFQRHSSMSILVNRGARYFKNLDKEYISVVTSIYKYYITWSYNISYWHIEYICFTFLVFYFVSFHSSKKSMDTHGDM